VGGVKTMVSRVGVVSLSVALAVMAATGLVTPSFAQDANCSCAGVAIEQAQSLIAGKSSEEITQAVADGVTQAPVLAKAVICAIATADTGTAQSAAAGLAKAQQVLGTLNAGAADGVSSAVACAAPEIQATYFEASETQTASSRFNLPFSTSDTTLNSVVSRAKP
jgi:hypothetical protein